MSEPKIIKQIQFNMPVKNEDGKPGIKTETYQYMTDSNNISFDSNTTLNEKINNMDQNIKDSTDELDQRIDDLNGFYNGLNTRVQNINSQLSHDIVKNLSTFYSFEDIGITNTDTGIGLLDIFQKLKAKDKSCMLNVSITTASGYPEYGAREDSIFPATNVNFGTLSVLYVSSTRINVEFNQALGVADQPRPVRNFIGQGYLKPADNSTSTPETWLWSGWKEAAYQSDINNIINGSTIAKKAEKAEALNVGKNAIGDETQPVYFNTEGKPVAINYTIQENVPKDAKFTDTTYTAATDKKLGLVKSGGVATIDSSGQITAISSATKATQDGKGQNIADTYATQASVNTLTTEVSKATKYEIGDMLTTVRNDLGEDWLECDGSVVSIINCPDLTKKSDHYPKYASLSSYVLNAGDPRRFDPCITLGDTEMINYDSTLKKNNDQYSLSYRMIHKNTNYYSPIKKLIFSDELVINQLNVSSYNTDSQYSQIKIFYDDDSKLWILVIFCIQGTHSNAHSRTLCPIVYTSTNPFQENSWKFIGFGRNVWNHKHIDPIYANSASSMITYNNYKLAITTFGGIYAYTNVYEIKNDTLSPKSAETIISTLSSTTNPLNFSRLFYDSQNKRLYLISRETNTGHLYRFHSMTEGGWWSHNYDLNLYGDDVSSSSNIIYFNGKYYFLANNKTLYSNTSIATNTWVKERENFANTDRGCLLATNPQNTYIYYFDGNKLMRTTNFTTSTQLHTIPIRSTDDRILALYINNENYWWYYQAYTVKTGSESHYSQVIVSNQLRQLPTTPFTTPAKTYIKAK